MFLTHYKTSKNLSPLFPYRQATLAHICNSSTQEEEAVLATQQQAEDQPRAEETISNKTIKHLSPLQLCMEFQKFSCKVINEAMYALGR